MNGSHSSMARNRRRVASAVFLVLVWMSCPVAEAGEGLPTIGELWYLDIAGAAPYREAFRSGLRDLGHVDGRNVTIVSLYADGDAARLPALTSKLIAMNVNVMLVTSRAVDIARKATATVPIVCVGFFDPVAEGLVQSLSRPGGNVTGLSWASNDASAKRVELTKETVAGLKHLALLFDATHPGAVVEAKAARAAANRAGLKAREFPIKDSETLESALRAMASLPPQALVVTHSPFTVHHRDRIIRFAAQHGIAVISEARDFADAGALLTYGPFPTDLFKRGALYVDRILKGAKPSELPIEQPATYELVVNLRTAKALKLTVPQAVLARASEIIR